MANSNSKKVLFVDDDLRIADLFENYFSNFSNITISKAHNGMEALELLKAQSYDALITDIKMPKMNGIELVSCIRTLGIKIPVLFLTGFGDKESAITAVKLGAVDFIEKPVNLEALLLSLKKALNASEEVFDRSIDQLALSGKLRNVMSGIIKGKTNSEIAAELAIAEPTVKYHVGNLLKKFNAEDREDLREIVLKKLKSADTTKSTIANKGKRAQILE